jgi:hypothetical protein
VLSFLLGSFSGFLALFAVLLTVALPYWLRKERGSLRPHYLLGYAILGAVVAHAMLSMGSLASRSMPAGLGFAYGATLLIVAQINLGERLRDARVNRHVTRRFHFAVMLGIVALALAHVYACFAG